MLVLVSSNRMQMNTNILLKVIAYLTQLLGEKCFGKTGYQISLLHNMPSLHEGQKKE